ncbi:oligosaccharide flippase family protein [bacterium]|nr:oligosaccharide flippase family protein [bacterium]
MRVTKQIIHGVALNNVVTLVEMGVGLLQQVIIIRYLLGLKQYGSLAFFQAGFGMLAIFFNLNLNYSAIRFGGAAQGKEDQNEFYVIQGTTFLLTFITNVLLLGVTLFLWFWGFEYEGKVVGEYFFLLAMNALAAVPAGFAGQIFTSRKEFKLLSFQQIFCAITSAVSVVLFCLMVPNIRGAIYGMIAGSIISSAVSIFMVRKDISRLRIDLGKTRSFGLYGGQFAISSIVKQFFWKADVLILGLFTGEKAVGLYRIAQTVANPLMRAFSPLWTVLFPTVATESGKGNIDNIRRLLFRGTQWLVLANLPIVIIGSFLLDFLVPRIYGVGDASVVPIRFLLWGFALGTMTSVSPPILRVYRNDVALLTTLAAAILSVALNLILIPAYQVKGAAVANFISFGLLAIAVYYSAFRAIGLKVLPLLTPDVMIQISFIAMIMTASILNYFWIALALFTLMLLYVFGFRIVTVSEFKAYLAS